jgi:predicted acyltransferase
MGREPRGDKSWRGGFDQPFERSARMQLQLAPKNFIEAVPVAPARRIASVDALRGFSIFWLIGGDGAIWALADMSSGKGPVVSGIGRFLGLQLHHVAWEGFQFYDFIFPLFIFVTGVAIVFSLSRLAEREGLWQAHVRVLRRSLLLYGLGLIYYGGISHHWADIRYVGVLQRIALCYLFASLFFLNFNLRGMMVAYVSLLLGYWALMTFVPVPGVGAGSFAPDANLANWLDARYLPGRLWDKTRDPEGMLSTLPAIGTCLLGVFAGLLLKDERLAAQSKSLWLIGAGIALVAAGHLWGLQFPVIKAIWTSSFVLVAGGYSLILLGVLHQIIDVWGLRRWSTIFVWLGVNAVMLYFLNNLFGFEPFALRFVGGDLSALIDHFTTRGTGLFLAHLLGLTFAIALAGFFYRRKIFLRV